MKDKVIIITGASSGIGKACSEVFAKRGACLSLAGRSVDKLEKLTHDLQAKGSDVIFSRTDVSNENDCKDLIQATIDKFGKIDGLINNAGISMRALFEETDLSVLKQVMAINFWGTVFCTKYALPHILQSKGSIVGITSIAGYKGLPGRSGYAASKFAIRGFLESIRIELLKKGVHVLIAAPGFTNSNIRNTALSKDGSTQKETPLNEKKLMSSEKVAEHIAKAIVKRKKEIVLTTQGKTTVFLNKWFPGFMDKMVYNHFAKEKDSPLK